MNELINCIARGIWGQIVRVFWYPPLKFDRPYKKIWPPLWKISGYAPGVDDNDNERRNFRYFKEGMKEEKVILKEINLYCYWKGNEGMT